MYMQCYLMSTRDLKKSNKFHSKVYPIPIIHMDVHVYAHINCVVSVYIFMSVVVHEPTVQVNIQAMNETYNVRVCSNSTHLTTCI